MQNTRVPAVLLSARNAKNRERVANHPPGANPASVRKEKKQDHRLGVVRSVAKIRRRRRRHTFSAGLCARFLKISLFLSPSSRSFVVSFFTYRVSFNRRKCEAYKNGVPLAAHSRVRSVSRVPRTLVLLRFSRPSGFPFAHPFANEGTNGVGERRGGGCVEGPTCLVLFHLLSFLSRSARSLLLFVPPLHGGDV